jgi:hypothetical protein
MTVRCLDCEHINLKASPRMANEGCGVCKLNPVVGEYPSYLYRRECKQFRRADEEKILKRYEWQEQLKEYRRIT